MKFDPSSSIILALASVVSGKKSTDYSHHRHGEATLNSSNARRTLQSTSSCLATSNFTTSFTHETCTPDQISLAISLAIADAGSTCNGASASSELASLLGTTEDPTEITTELQLKCDTAFASEILPFKKITRRGDAFDREFFAGGSNWNDQYQTIDNDGGTTSYHNLKYDASRIMYEMQANSVATRPIEFPSYLPQFDNCNVGAVMCCHVSDRQSNDLEGTCNDATGTGDGCADADPLGNTDVCVASMADAQVSNRVQKGLAVYHLNDQVEASEGSVNCHGFAWDNVDAESGSSRYKGNMLFDVAFKQSLYDKGYVKNVPGAPMCGCIEQMPTVTRADCTKISSVAETYTLSATLKKPTLVVKLTDSGVQYGPCDTDEDLASHYKSINNAENAPSAIDTKLVGDGGCFDSIDSSVQAFGYKRSVLEITESYFIPPDVNPARVIIKFNTEVSGAAASMGSFKVYDVANLGSELGIASSSLTWGNTAVELVLTDVPSSSVSYQVSNLVTLHKQIAPMVTIEAGSSPTDIAVTSFLDELQIGQNWKLAQMFDGNNLSVSGREHDGSPAQTPMVYQSDGNLITGPTEDFNSWSEEATYSTFPPKFGDKTLEINNWRIRQVDAHYLSITHVSGRIVRLYRSDGERFPKWHIPAPQDDIYSAYNVDELGVAKCAFLTDKFLQLGDWRIGEYDQTHLSVSHKRGMTSMIYRRYGTGHPGPSPYYSTWDFPIGTILQGTTSGCDSLFV
ncbi:hypothetical protein ACHAXR_009433 [Thalassiosira sp. AJA248-18]